MEIGGRRDFVVEAYSPSGTVVPFERAGVTFMSSDTAIVIVGRTGSAIAVRNGQAEITVAAGGQSRCISVTVGPAVTSSVGGPLEPTPVVRFPTPTAAISGPAIASAVIARIEAAIAVTTTLALGVGGSTALDVRAIGSAGTRMTSVTLVWRSVDTTIARVDAQGTIVGLSAGATTITLDLPGLDQARWPVTVAPTTVRLGVKQFSIDVGSLRTLTATLRGSADQEFGPAASEWWTSSNPSVATIDGAGKLSAKKPGRSVVLVEQPGSGVDTVTVFVTGRALISGSLGATRGIWQLLGVNDTVPEPLVVPDTVALSSGVVVTRSHAHRGNGGGRRQSPDLAHRRDGCRRAQLAHDQSGEHFSK